MNKVIIIDDEQLPRSNQRMPYLLSTSSVKKLLPGMAYVTDSNK